MKINHLNGYDVNPLTMAVISEIGKAGEKTTRVMEEELELTIDTNPLQIIQKSCKFFGVSLKGRQEGTAAVCGITYKAPITIDPSIGLYFFPTHSPTNPDCSWLSHSHIEKLEPVENKATEVIFKNGKRITINVSYGSIMNQVQRTAQYRYLMETRLNQMRMMNSIVAENPPSALRESISPFYGSRE